MEIPSIDDWPLDAASARTVQETLAPYVITEDRFAPPRLVAGVDVGFEDRGKTTRAAVVLLDFPSLENREQAISRTPTRFPYIPGYLSFREIPGLLEGNAKPGKLKNALADVVDEIDELFAVRARRGVDDDEIGVTRGMSEAALVAGDAGNRRAIFRP